MDFFFNPSRRSSDNEFQFSLSLLNPPLHLCLDASVKEGNGKKTVSGIVSKDGREAVMGPENLQANGKRK